MSLEHTESGFGKNIHKICTVFNIIASVLLFILMVLGAADVIGRYFFNAPINGAMETGQILLALMVFFSWGNTQIQKEHVNVALFVSHFPERLKNIAGIFTTSLSLALFILIVWRSTVAALDTFKSGELVYVIRWPLAPFQLFVPIGGIFLCLVLILDLVHCVHAMKRRG